MWVPLTRSTGREKQHMRRSLRGVVSPKLQGTAPPKGPPSGNHMETMAILCPGCEEPSAKGFAYYGFGAISSDHRIVIGPADDASGDVEEGLAARAAVVPGTAVERIVAGPAVEEVVAVAAEQLVVVGVATQEV